VIVADASAVIEFLLGTDTGTRVESTLGAYAELHAPALLDVEVAQVVRRLEREGAIGPAHGHALIELLQDLPVTRHRMDPLLPRTWDWRENLTAYDAAYVALAEALECPLLTTDARISGTPGMRLEIIRPE